MSYVKKKDVSMMFLPGGICAMVSGEKSLKFTMVLMLFLYIVRHCPFLVVNEETSSKSTSKSTMSRHVHIH